MLATEKRLPSTLMDVKSVYKISLLTDSIGVVYAGMGPDSRILIAQARKSAQAYKKQYGESIPVQMLVKRIAAIMQQATQSGGVRPFGVSLLVAGFDQEGPQLCQIDPSGSYFAWKASAIGKNMINAKTFLEKRYSEDIELEDAIHTAILTLKEGFEGQVTEDNIEIGTVADDGKFRPLSPAEIKDYLAEVE